MNILILAGILCLCGECVHLDHNVTVHIQENITEECRQPVYGCAYPDRVYVLDTKNDSWRMATLFHELLHVELGPEHTKEMIRRDNALRDKLGVRDRYLWMLQENAT